MATEPFQECSRLIARQSREEHLRRALARFAFDGTEVHRVIDRELRGLENELVASAIRHANQVQYRNCVPLDAVVEIVGKLIERTWD